MKRILLMGLGAKATAAGVRSWLGGFGPVLDVHLVRDGDAESPLAVVEMDITDGQAFLLESRISNYWHDGALVNARLLPY